MVTTNVKPKSKDLLNKTNSLSSHRIFHESIRCYRSICEWASERGSVPFCPPFNFSYLNVLNIDLTVFLICLSSSSSSAPSSPSLLSVRSLIRFGFMFSYLVYLSQYAILCVYDGCSTKTIRYNNNNNRMNFHQFFQANNKITRYLTDEADTEWQKYKHTHTEWETHKHWGDERDDRTKNHLAFCHSNPATANGTKWMRFNVCTSIISLTH